MDYHFLVPVWGSDYINRFLNIGLPSLLAEGNLPSFPAGSGTFHIFSRATELTLFEQSPAFQALQKIMATPLHAIDHIDLRNPYLGMTRCHQVGLSFGVPGRSCYFFIPPDAVWSKGSFAHLRGLCDAGKKAVMIAGVRARAYEMERALARLRNEQRLDIGARDLVRLALANLHPMSIGHLNDGGRFRAIQNLYWEVPGEGLLARCFHLHPVLVRPDGPVRDLRGTVDDDLIPMVCSSMSDLHVVKDSDDACMFELSDIDHGGVNNKMDYYSKKNIEDWIRTAANRFHRQYVAETIVQRATDLNPRWDVVRAEADEVVRTLFNPHGVEQHYYLDPPCRKLPWFLRPLRPVKRTLVRWLRRFKPLARRICSLVFWPVNRKIEFLERERQQQFAELQNLKNVVLCLQRELREREWRKSA